jgi:DNA polymerase-3 subunit delta'
LLEQAIHLRIATSPPSLLSKGEEELDYNRLKFTFTIPEKEKDFAERLNKIAGIEQQQAIIEELDKATYYIERNAHGKILFHALTIKLYHIIQDKIVFLTD